MPAYPVTGRHALRSGRVSIPGQIYLLTITTYQRRRLFLDPICARGASRAIYSEPTWGDAKLLARVLMPDHWHGLVQLGSEPLGHVMDRSKAGVTRALHASQLADGKVWDRSFHDRALRADEDVRQAARYIVANPVRAGLVQNVLDYPYWDAVWPNPDSRLSSTPPLLLQEPARGRCFS